MNKKTIASVVILFAVISVGVIFITSQKPNNFANATNNPEEITLFVGQIYEITSWKIFIYGGKELPSDRSSQFFGYISQIRNTQGSFVPFKIVLQYHGYLYLDSLYKITQIDTSKITLQKVTQ